MASPNEILNALATAYRDAGRLDEHSAAALDHSGKLYIRIDDQVFEIEAAEVDFQSWADPTTPDDFMNNLPFVIEKR
ncbi:hypothetical protein [Rhizobium sp. Leaf341]|uniref:hypothetical protein n=1 Tax=Rhizobium sp. Leaf341 TaxID=1736344 RepID=UPI000714ABB8|nr:hypothetical protein [Rhizobium sp. Leaf341]KQR79277.1 hypothetical protein ASG03_12055 [Rhizobium sp. Leaf341]